MQVVEVVQEQAKLEWLLSRLPAMIDSGEVLVFANQIVRVEEVAEKVKSAGHRSAPGLAMSCLISFVIGSELASRRTGQRI